MPTQLQPYRDYTDSSIPVVTPTDVVAELGKVVSENSPCWTEEERTALMGRWIAKESAMAMYFTDYDPESEDNTAIEVIILEEAILYKVCARALRHAQINWRTGLDSYAPNYVYLIEEYERMATILLNELLRKRVDMTVTSSWIRENYPTVWQKYSQYYSDLPEDTTCDDDD